MNYKLSICIPVFNKKNFTISCLKDLVRLPEDHQIVVVDNNSTDGTHDLIKSQFGNMERILYHKSEANLGFAKGSNLAYHLSSGENVMFLNNDIRVNSDHGNWTDAILQHCDDYIVGPTMGELDDNCNFIKESNNYLTSKYSYMSGWCIASSRKNWEKLKIKRYSDFILDDKEVAHIFDEKYSPAYFEDADLSMRAKVLNIPFKVVQIPVHHFGRITSKQLNTHALYRNSQKIFIKSWTKHKV
jgi:GT2 family glycosyltransferase